MGSSILAVSVALVVIPIALLLVIGLLFGSVPTFIQQMLALPLIIGAVGTGAGIAVTAKR